MFRKLGSFAVRFKFSIIGVWLAAAALMFFFAPSLSQVGSMKESDFLPKNSESLRATELLAQYFPGERAASTVSLIFYDANGISTADLDYARQVRDWLASGQTTFKVADVTSVFDDSQLEATLYSPDRTTMLMNAGLEQAAFESKSIATTQEIRDQLKSAPAGLKVYVSGEIGIYGDMFSSLNKSINLTTLVTIILVIVLLLIIYRSPVAVLVPLLTIGIAFIVSRGTIGYIAQAGVSIWSQLDVFLIVLIFGIGTDYCLFLISRFREELGRQDSRVEAMRTTVGRIGAVITASASAVMVGLAGMYVARYQMIKTMGPMMGLAILITLLAALTLAPALASVFGRILFWPRREEPRADKAPQPSKFWGRIAKISTGKPIIVAGIIIIVMLVPYLAMPALHRSFDQLAEIPSDADSIQGYKILQEHYNIGEIDPMTAIIVAPPGKKLTDPDALAALGKISSALSSVPGVASVQSIIQPQGDGQTPASLTVSGQLGAISGPFSSSSNGSSANISSLLSDDLVKSLTGINAYLGELSGNFTWVKSEASYQASFGDLSAISQTLQALKAAVAGGQQTTEASLAAQLKTQFATLTADLQTLGTRFMANGNPVFLSPSLLASSAQLKALEQTFISSDGQATRLYIMSNAYPQSESALTIANNARNALKTSINNSTLKQADADTGGTSAVLADVRQTLDRDFNIVMVVVIAAIFVVLGILLKSLIAPIYLLMTVLLSYGATLGIITWIFQDIMGQAGISFMIPIVLFVLLVALGSDYNIFLMSRVREESETHVTREGARLAAMVTGAVITACGIILAGTFASLVITPIRTLTQLGAAVAIGVFIDTFLVRAMLVPAIASLLGRWNWWPVKHG
jgi:RND superfamily putative drug exporter